MARERIFPEASAVSRLLIAEADRSPINRCIAGGIFILCTALFRHIRKRHIDQ
jgi:hypothetical protein